jgi:hypothetical protein
MARCSRCDEAMQHIKYFNAILERFLGWCRWYAYDFDSLAEPLNNSFECTGFVCDCIQKFIKK